MTSTFYGSILSGKFSQLQQKDFCNAIWYKSLQTINISRFMRNTKVTAGYGLSIYDELYSPQMVVTTKYTMKKT